jgi:integrase
LDIYEFIESFDKSKLATKVIYTGILKGFFTYLQSNQQLPNGLSLIPPRVNYKKGSKLPSTFTTDEVSALLNSIDRASPRGKRDYAILLLAIKLGMRSSDIRALRFENILWDKNLIKFTQKKTGKSTMLPLLTEIGNAIVDYLKYGRPESKEPYCFLRAMSPYTPMHYGEVNSLTQQNLARAGIDLRGRKHGPHALRHSFASRLLEGKTPLPVISEAMGHSRTQSTMTYLRIDIDTLRQCALDVPALPSFFYPKRGEQL